MSYAEFFQGLAELARALDVAAAIGGELEGMPTPYLHGTVEVRLDGQRVGEFEFVDEKAIYFADSEAHSTTLTAQMKAEEIGMSTDKSEIVNLRLGNERLREEVENKEVLLAASEFDRARLRRIEEAMREIDALRGEPGSFAEIARKVWAIARAALADHSTEEKT